MFQPKGTGGELNERQNDEHGMQLNACFGIAYEKSKRINYAYFCIALLLPFLLSLAMLLFPQPGQGWWECIAAILLVPVTIMLSRWQENAQWHAADIQQLFDCYVFDMPWKPSLWGEKPDIPKRLSTRAEKKLKDKDYYKKRVDWYSDSYTKLTSSDAGVGILNCQRMNTVWETALRRRFSNFCIAIAAVAVVGVCLFTALAGLGAEQVMRNLVLLLPIIIWVLDQYFALQDDLCRLKLMQKVLEQTEPEDGFELLLLQRAILDHRRDNAQIPTFFYELFKPKE